MEVGVVVTAAIFLAGVIFHSGQLTERVKHLEKWREEIRADVSAIFSMLRSIQGHLGIAHDEEPAEMGRRRAPFDDATEHAGR